MKRIALIAAACLCTALVFAGGKKETPESRGSSASGDADVKIGISKIVQHPALDATEQGIMDALNAAGINASFDLQNANGDVNTAAQISNKFKSDKVSVAVGIATPVAVSLANTIKDIPVAFSAVTDPVGAGLVTSLDKGEGNVTGLSDAIPTREHIEMFKDIANIKTLGYIYTSNEANSISALAIVEAACEEFGLTLVTQSISNSAEVKQAAQSIAKRIDAMYIATDNTVISALTSVADVCSTNGVALMSADPTSVEGLDFLVAWGFNYYKIGLATGRVVKEILIDKKAPGDIGTVFLTDPDDLELWLSLDSAKKLGITIPADLLETAAVTIEGGKKIVK